MKKIFLITLMLSITVLMVGMVNGALSIDEPDTNDYVKAATYIINGTEWSGVYTANNGNCTNVTLDYRVSGGSTYTYIGANTSNDNITADWQLTFDTMTLKDDTTYSLRARCFDNNSNNSLLETATEVTFKVDNTVPISTLSTPTDKSKDVDGKVTLTYTCTNASSATLYLEDAGGYVLYTMTESSDVCTYAATIVTNGFHSHYAITSDGLNTTTSTTSTVEVRRPGGYIYDEYGDIIDGTGVTTSENKLGEFLRQILAIPVRIVQTIINMISGLGQ